MATLSSPTLGKLISNVRNLLGQPNAANSKWGDDELTDYINKAVSIAFAKIVKNYEGYFTTTTNLDYTSGTETVALPTDCFEVRALYIKRSQGYSLLEYRNDVTHGYWTQSGSGDPNVYQPFYFFQGNNLVLHPVPNQTSTGGALKLDYIQLPDQLVNGGDTLTNQLSPVFTEFVEMYAVYKAKLKQSMTTGTDLTALPKESLKAAYDTLMDTITPRSAYPRFTDPFVPECY